MTAVTAGRQRHGGTGAGMDPVVVFSGGGTGGHLYPALALARALESSVPGLSAFFVGARRGLEARVLPQKAREHLLVPVEGFNRDRILANVGVLLNLGVSFLSVLRAFLARRPRLVVVTGGYAAGPAGLAAAVLRIPLVIQEQNAVPGVTVRWLARFARQIHVAFPEAAGHLPSAVRNRVRVSGNPIEPPTAVDRAEALDHFGLDPALPVVLVVGGSQGSLALNRGVLAAVRTWEESSTAVEPRSETSGSAVPQSSSRSSEGGADRKGESAPFPPFQLLWSTGPAHIREMEDALGELGSPRWVRPVAYIHGMAQALGIATLAVSRAGAMATSEFLAWGIPSILVPLPTAAADHQRKNAAALEEAGAAVLLPEDRLEGEDLLRRIQELVSDPSHLAIMTQAARQRGRPAAAREIAESLRVFLPDAPPEPREAS